MYRILIHTDLEEGVAGAGFECMQGKAKMCNDGLQLHAVFDYEFSLELRY